MILSIHQPAYLPWLGYLDRIARSDRFVFLDTVQFEKNSFTNRNRIKTAAGPLWLTVPVLHGGHLSGTLRDTRIDVSRHWVAKHLRSIEMAYRKAPRFAVCFPRLAALYEVRHERLADLCWAQLRFWLDEFGIRTPVLRASELAVEGRGSALVLAICRRLGATEYLAGPLGRNYLAEADFHAARVRVRYHDYESPRYPQLHGEFVPALAALDHWFNCPGPPEGVFPWSDR